jgi:hypothetical protein
MAVPQITIRLSPATKAEFDSYAAGLGLMASELAKLLIVRERVRRRLADVFAAGELPTRERRAGGRDDPLPTVTAHLSLLEEVKSFDAYAHQFGLNRTTAGAWLLETELRERWLERAIRG